MVQHIQSKPRRPRSMTSAPLSHLPCPSPLASTCAVDLLGLPTRAMTFNTALDLVTAWATRPQRRYISTATVYTLMQAREDRAVRSALLDADVVVADGMPLVWMQQGAFPLAERIYGPDILLQVAALTEHRPIRHLYWGSTPDVTARMVANLRARFPALSIAGWHSPPTQALETRPLATTIDYINAQGAHIVWVGLGSPKQDQWMRLYRHHLDAPLLIGVGAAFDFIAGTTPQAPRWMQSRGLEWLFRLMMEPRRLWKRYLLYNPKFIYTLARMRWAGSRWEK